MSSTQLFSLLFIQKTSASRQAAPETQGEKIGHKNLGKFHEVFGGNDGGNVEFIHDHPAFGTHENGGRNPPTFFVTKPWKMLKEP